MLELFSSGLVSLWLNLAGIPQAANPAGLTALQETPWIVLPGDPDTFTQTTLQQYLKNLSGKGMAENTQGIWLQSGATLLASNQGSTPLPAASLTKIATSLVALKMLGPNHQFETVISTNGTVQNGVLQGDLTIQGGSDPLLVWEEAIALGNSLNRLGIRKVTGNLVITGNFLMNFETEPLKAGELFKQALDSKAWSSETEYQFQALPKGTARPQVAIAGSIQVVTYGKSLLPKQTPLLRHQSLPLAKIVKLMNLYSNNVIAESLADFIGGATVVAQQAQLLADVSPQEIFLKNGSGLGLENKISPRAVCAMFAAIQRYMQPHGLTVADLFPIAGLEGGTIEDRKIPMASVVKTGTLNDVSALAGVMPTRDRGLVWFAILNRGTNLDDLRNQQDALLQMLVKQWGAAPAVPIAISPISPQTQPVTELGDETRNQIVRTAVEVNTF